MSKKNLIHIDSSDVIDSLVPVNRILVLTVLLAIRDRATEVRFDPSVPDDKWKLSYKVDGSVWDLVPVPLLFPVSRAARKLASLGQIRGLCLKLRGMLAQAGRPVTSRAGYLCLSVADTVVDLEVLVETSRAGRLRALESIVIRLPEGPLPSEKARELVRQYVQKRALRKERSSVAESTDSARTDTEQIRP